MNTPLLSQHTLTQFTTSLHHSQEYMYPTLDILIFEKSSTGIRMSCLPLMYYDMQLITRWYGVLGLFGSG